ncbi:hypothetical protein phiOC_p133 [Ochrobactrum phage vB_OspM_OC]|nr:hypothetical protein phiOC_p133 [Ochrobactrum phage vB_OspM_OC]
MTSHIEIDRIKFKLAEKGNAIRAKLNINGTEISNATGINQAAISAISNYRLELVSLGVLFVYCELLCKMDNKTLQFRFELLEE